MRHILLTALLLALLAPPLARASTYQWRDDNGVTHFTDDPDSIPARFVNRAKELASVRSETKPAPQAPAGPGTATLAPTAIEPTAAEVDSSDKAQLSRELKGLQESLAAKKKELARLYHKWSVAKGRTPTKEEIAEFEKKRAAGKATFKDNPYVSKNPLATPAPARLAYFRKLEEVRKDEEKVSKLEQKLQGLR